VLLSNRNIFINTCNPSLWGVMMKTLLAILGIILLIGCTQQADTETKTPVLPEGFVVLSEQEAEMDEPEPETKEFTVRAFDKGYSPEVITVNQGDTVRLFVTNTLTDDEDIVVGIEEYVESKFSQGGTVVLEFDAEEKGSFAFGDMSSNGPKGLIIVR